jgi:uncharacterized protein YgiM (DUF1202 family)
MWISTGCGTSPQPLPEDDAFGNIRRSSIEADDPSLIVGAKSNNIIWIKNALLSGEDVNLTDHEGKSALWYAFQYENFDAFKLLLENGADSSWLNHKAVSDSYRKLKLFKMAKEYELVSRIKARPTADLSLFDAYFSEFSNGYYVSDVEAVFGQLVRRDYGKKEWQKFLDKYGRMGQHCYLITGSDLNIRSDPSLESKILGKYMKGERVFARTSQGGWIQTDRGWISTQYAKHIRKTIPVLLPYLQGASRKLGQEYKPYPVIAEESETELQPAESGAQFEETEAEKQPEETELQPAESQVPPELIGKDATDVQKELADVLKNPTLHKLEGFINKYQNKKACQAEVKRAKEEYKKILLRDL